MALIRYGRVDDFMQMDLETTKAKGIPASLLMENAGNEMGRLLLDREKISDRPVAILSGKGHNGGDGLVLARYLAKHGVPVTIYLYGGKRDNRSSLFMEKLKLLDHFPVEVFFFREAREVSGRIRHFPFVVDSLLGTGLNRPLVPPFSTLIDKVNLLPCRRIALDIPSGLTVLHQGSTAFRAHLTATVQMTKEIFLYSWYRPYLGDVVSVPIDFPPSVWKKYTRTIHRVDEEIPPDKGWYENKFHRGRSLACTGSSRYPGAAFLTVQGALQNGASYLQVMSPVPIPPSFYPESIRLPNPEKDVIDPLCFDRHQEVFFKSRNILFGSGVGRSEETTEFLIRLLTLKDKRFIIDADGLWHLKRVSTSRSFLKWSRSNEVLLTPHLGEFSDWVGHPAKAIKGDFFSFLDECRRRMNVSLLVKDAWSYLWGKQKYYFPYPSDYLSKAGSGDVLAGTILGHLSLYNDFEEAVVQATYAFAQKARRIRKEQGPLAPLSRMVTFEEENGSFSS